MKNLSLLLCCFLLANVSLKAQLSLNLVAQSNGTITNASGSTVSVNTMNPATTPLVGDIDNDGDIEIVMIKNHDVNNGDVTIIILNAIDGSVHSSFIAIDASVPPQVVKNYANATFQPGGNLAMGDIVTAHPITGVPAPGAEVLFVSNSSLSPSYIYCYNLISKNLMWVSSDPVDYEEEGPFIANFDGGDEEVYAGRHVFNASNGALISSGGMNSSGNYSAGKSPCRDFQYTGCINTWKGSYPVAADVIIDGTDILELVAGNVVYEYSTSGTMNVVKEAKNSSDPTKEYFDGFTSVADINIDGTADAVVVSWENDNSLQTGYWKVYGWDLVTEEVIGEYAIPWPNPTIPSGGTSPSHAIGGFAGRVNITNLDCDPKLEMVFISQDRMFFIDDDFSLIQIIQTNDESSGTGISSFDFDGDGLTEIVYRSEDSLSIYAYDLGTGSIKLKLPSVECKSPTANEYPTIAQTDLDPNNNKARICVPCVDLNTSSGNGGPSDYKAGKIHIYEINNLTNYRSARPVMNQHTYLNTNVNDNLTIPYPQVIHYKNKPLNIFMNQVDKFPNPSSPIYPSADATIEINSITTNSSGTHITYTVCNTNSAGIDLPIGTPINFYNGNPTLNNVTVIGSAFTTAALLPGLCMALAIDIPQACDEVFALINYDNTSPTPVDLLDGLNSVPFECDYTNNISSDTVKCCFASLDSNYVIKKGFVFSDEVWSNKIYVEESVTVDGAVLDITNVDVVFAKNTKIELINGARLRASNSTFRPCDESEDWIGIEVNDGSTVNLTENVFKSAITAINLLTSNSVEIENNEIKNSQIGILAQPVSTSFLHHIVSGNTFSVSPFTNFIGDHHGIILSGVTNTVSISQNNFIGSWTEEDVNRFYGVSALNSSFMLSDNTFTNNYRAIDIGSGNEIYIQTNEFAQAVSLETDHRIRVSNSSNLWILDNEFDINERNVTSLTQNISAIYVENCSATKIGGNEINGFGTAIAATNVLESIISDNIISDIGYIGISLSKVENTYVGCNDINMDFSEYGVENRGIEYYREGTEFITNVIYGNCITEATHAILLHSPDVANLPTLVNNHLYNYSLSGVNNHNLIGSIGSGSGAATAGRNSFISNNLGNAAFDIITNVALSEGGNFGIITTSGSITPLGGKFSSTASCAKQLPVGDPLQYQIEDIFRCDNFEDPLIPLMRKRSATVDTYESNTVLAKLLRYRKEGEALKMNQLYENWYDHSTSSDADKINLSINFNIELGNYEEVELLNGEYPFLNRVPFLDQMRAKLIAGNLSLNEISEQEREELLALNADRSNSSARDILHIIEGGNDYLFNYKTIQAETTKGKDIKHFIESDDILVYPNPTNNMIKVSFAPFENISVLHLYSIEGRKIRSLDLQPKTRWIELNVAHLDPGIYIIQRQSDNQASKNIRFVKQ